MEETKKVQSLLEFDIMPDILDRVLITPESLAMYVVFAADIAEKMREPGVDSDNIPEAQAKVRDDGALIVFTDFEFAGGKGHVEFCIPASGWLWRDQN